jgi:hypothetical protein
MFSSCASGARAFSDAEREILHRPIVRRILRLRVEVISNSPKSIPYSCPLLRWSAPISGHNGVTRQFWSNFGGLNSEGANVFETRVQRGFCEWCREGELNPQDPKVGGF